MSHPLQRASPPLSWSWAGSSVCSCQLGFTRNPVQRLSWHLCIQTAFSGIWSLHFREFGAQLNSKSDFSLVSFLPSSFGGQPSGSELWHASLTAHVCGHSHPLQVSHEQNTPYHTVVFGRSWELYGMHSMPDCGKRYGQMYVWGMPYDTQNDILNPPKR